MRTTTISVLGILVEMLQYRTESTALPSKSDPVFEPIKKTVLYIRTHYAEKLTLDLLSKIALIDKYRLSHTFKSYTGLTVMQYANQYRCEAAKDFLRGGQTVRETAELCGFNNLSFFTRMFKKCTGKMPSDYKKSKFSACYGRPFAGIRIRVPFLPTFFFMSRAHIRCRQNRIKKQSVRQMRTL